MFDKCIPCPRIGENCVPNLMLLPFADLIKWCIKRQKHLGWSNQVLAEKSCVPVGTINRIWAGDYQDCKYSTIKNILIALIGGTTDEFSCTEQVERELQQKEQLEKSVARLFEIEEENKRLKDRLSRMDEQHRKDIRAVREEYQEQIVFLHEQIVFLKDELKAWRSWHQAK